MAGEGAGANEVVIEYVAVPLQQRVLLPTDRGRRIKRGQVAHGLNDELAVMTLTVEGVVHLRVESVVEGLPGVNSKQLLGCLVSLTRVNAVVRFHAGLAVLPLEPAGVHNSL